MGNCRTLYIAVAKAIRTMPNTETFTYQSFSFCPLPFAITTAIKLD